MAKDIIVRGETSVIRHIFIQDSTSTTGAGKTALAYDTSSLTAYYIYPGGTATALTLETISTLGTYAAPTSAAHMRFKKIDDTNMPGIYEVQFHNDWFSVASARRGATVQMKGATGMAPVQFEFDLVGFDLNDADPGVDVVKISGDATAADDFETMLDGTGGKVLTLAQLRINSSAAGGGIDIDNSAGAAINASGTIGLYAVGSGASNYGIEAVGTGATDSGGIKASATTAGEGIEGVAAGNGHGLLVVGAGTGEGLHATAGGGANGHGAHFEGVGANSSGLLLSRGGTGGDDLNFANNDVTIANVTTVNGLAANVITAASIATNAIDADALAADAVTEIWAGSTAPTAAAVADAVWDEASTGHTDAGKAGAQVWTDIDAILDDTDDIGVAGAGLTALPWNAAWDAEVESEATDALNAYDPPTKTELDSGFTALNDLSAAEVNAEMVDVLTVDVIADSVAADGSRPTIAQAALMILRWLTERSVTGTTMTITKEDGVTAVMTFTLSDATQPTSITRAS